jgi:hypothetical protein
MRAVRNGLKERLARYRQIEISVIGRKSWEGNLDSGLVRVGKDKLYLLRTFCP